MQTIQSRSWLVIAGLVMLMALTRFNHFGSALVLPDASWAVFFLGGLYLARFSGALWVFAALSVETVLVDYYAIAAQDVSAWCVTNAYGFLIFAYAALWLAGRWFAPRHTLSVKSLAMLCGVVGAAASAAFVISNASFFLFSGRYAEMGALEYASRVAQYLGSYIALTLAYVACAVLVHMAVLLLSGKTRHDSRAV